MKKGVSNNRANMLNNTSHNSPEGLSQTEKTYDAAKKPFKNISRGSGAVSSTPYLAITIGIFLCMLSLLLSVQNASSDSLKAGKSLVRQNVSHNTLVE